MGRLSSDSPICRNIVLAFLDFIQSVEPAPGVDPEGLDVARECLEEAFKIDQSSADYSIQPGLLVNLFSSAAKPSELNSDSTNIMVPPSEAAPTPSLAEAHIPGSSKREEQHRGPLVEGFSKDELFGQFYAALDKINFFMVTPGGEEDHVQLAKATHFFEEALFEMEKSGNQIINRASLAETFKSQGNQNMQAKLYHEAIDLYTCAIALSDKNAIYYCNRAAAYTQIRKYAEAITDCKKSIEIDPNYAKAYSREGLVYYALGKYEEAVLVFLKALQLDPNNEFVRENIRVAQQKMREERFRAESEHQSSGSSRGQQQDSQSAGPRSHAAGFQMPISVSNIAQAVMNMVPAAGTDHSQEQDRNTEGSQGRGCPFIPTNSSNSSTDGSNQTGSRADTDIYINIQELPQALSGVLGSVVNMFASQDGQQENSHRN